MNTGNVSQLYDLRGERRLREGAVSIGSESVEAPFRAPYRYAEDLLRAALKQGAKDMVDVCTGTGIHAVMAASLGFQVVGVDISPKSIEAASHLARANRLEERCQFAVADVAQWARENRQFDVVYISGSLYYLRRVMDVSTVLKLVRPGGLFVAVETNGSNLIMSVVRRLRALLFKDRDQTTVHHLLKVKEVDALAKSFVGGASRYFDFLSLGGALLARVSPKLAGAYLVFARPLDRAIMAIPGFRYLAFKFVLSGRVPVRS